MSKGRQSRHTEAVWLTDAAKRRTFRLRMEDCGVYPSVRLLPGCRRSVVFAAYLDPPGVPRRRVEVVFTAAAPKTPRVFADGPHESPHRYADGALCMWFPNDPPPSRWTFADGPAALLGHISAHLQREEWWRRTGEWAGAEAPHGVTAPR